MWQSEEIFNVSNTLTLKQIFWKAKTFFKKLEYRFLIAQLAHDILTMLGFGCFLVATSDNVVLTLSQSCISDVVTMTKN